MNEIEQTLEKLVKHWNTAPGKWPEKAKFTKVCEALDTKLGKDDLIVLLAAAIKTLAEARREEMSRAE